MGISVTSSFHESSQSAVDLDGLEIESTTSESPRSPFIDKDNVCKIILGESSAMVIERNLRKPESKTARKQRLTQEKRIAKHGVKEQCDCLKMCSVKISHERRVAINDSFNRLDPVSQKLYIRSQTNVVRNAADQSLRKVIQYFFYDEQEEQVSVCQKFFVTTLGFNPNNNTVVRNALNLEFPAEDQRGKYTRNSELNESMVVEHIMGFHPEVSHHRREHAPNRLYLPSDVSITKMHSIFNESHPDTKSSYEYYRKIVDKMNISFTKLGHEKCEDCEKYEQHKPSCTATESESNCDFCSNHLEHKRRYDKARIEYTSDKVEPFDPNHIKVSTDQQKVVMLPRMEQFKDALFTKRLRVFNQTFAPLGSTKMNPVFACVWHDGIAGKKKEEVISSYHAFFLKYRDAKEITIWCDNCAAQNKCWALFSFFVYIINSSEISAHRINIKYLQKGHTFMSADSFHHQVELSMKNRENSSVYDFADFVDAVETANGGRTICKELNFFDFAEWRDFSSTTKLTKTEPRAYVHDFAKLMFVRGKKVMLYANDLDDEFTELDFIMTKEMKLERSTRRTSEKGIPEETKAGIIAKLTPLMPPNRRQFWENL